MAIQVVYVPTKFNISTSKAYTFSIHCESAGTSVNSSSFEPLCSLTFTTFSIDPQ